jgi:hypothetical protein
MKKQSRFIRSHIYIGMVLFFLSLGAVYVWYVGGSYRKESFEKQVFAVYTNCADQSKGSFEYACLRKNIHDLVDATTLAPLLEIFENILQSDNAFQKYGVYTCHPSAHVVGEIAMKKGISFSTIQTQCGRSCDYGCVHGAFVVSLSKAPITPESIRSFCSEYSDSEVRRDMTSCGHIVGHGLGELFAFDISKGLSLCDSMPEIARHACGQGFIMQHFVVCTLLRYQKAQSKVQIRFVIVYHANLVKSAFMHWAV